MTPNVTVAWLRPGTASGLDTRQRSWLEIGDQVRYAFELAFGNSCVDINLVVCDCCADAHDFGRAQIAVHDEPIGGWLGRGDDQHIIHIRGEHFDLAAHIRTG